METRASYILVGLFVIGVAAAAFLFTIWLSGGDDNNTYTRYSIQFDESVNGLTEGSIVRYRGVSVGKVADINIDKKQPDLIRVLVDIADYTPITVDTRATLKSQGVTGVSYIELVGSGTGRKVMLKEGDAFPVIQSDKSELSKLFQTTPDLIENANEIAARVNILLSIENIENISKTVENMERISAALAANDKKFSNLMDEITKMSKSLNQMSATLNKTAVSLDKTIAGSGDNIVQFSNTGLRAITRFFNESSKTAIELRETSRKIKDNPSALIYRERSEKDETKPNN